MHWKQLFSAAIAAIPIASAAVAQAQDDLSLAVSMAPEMAALQGATPNGGILNLRVEGLSLGGSLVLQRGDAVLTVALNGDHVMPDGAVIGEPLALEVVQQPQAQACSLSELAPATVPADGAAVFVRCVSLETESFEAPFTLPDDALKVMFDEQGLRPLAYPGIPYESRPGVVGGQFPYEFRLLEITRDGQPVDSGEASLDFRRGTLRFTPAQPGLYLVTIEIRDSAVPQKVLQHQASIGVDAAPFLFVATDGDDVSGSGAIGQPFRTIGHALAQSLPEQVLMLRRGVYDSAGFDFSNARSRQVLAFPDEVVIVDLDWSDSINVAVDQLPLARIEGLDFLGVEQYGIHADPARAGLVVRNVRFVEGREGNTPSENPAFIHGRGDAETRHQLLIQDNYFGSYVELSSGAYALTLFDAGDSLIEDNRLHLGDTTGGIHDKDNSQRNTYRGNYIEFSPADTTPNGIQVSAQANSERVHIHHNLLINSGVRLGVQCFQESCYMREHDVHHNTVTGVGVLLSWGVFNPTSSATRISHNILSTGSAAPYAWHSCLGSVPSDMAAQLHASSNLIATGSQLAMRDTECSGGPMNMTWAQWRDDHGLDAKDTVLQTDDPLVGTGPLTGLPIDDVQRLGAGHLYLLEPETDHLFSDRFED